MHRWLKPEVVAERVWLRGGALHIIPLPSKDLPSIPEQPLTSEALKLVCSNIETAASSRIQVRHSCGVVSHLSNLNIY